MNSQTIHLYTVSNSLPAPVRMIRDYKPECMAVLTALISNGFTLTGIDDGGGFERFLPDYDLPSVESRLSAVDDCHLYVRHTESGRKGTLLFVFGNGPGELVADYSAFRELETVLSTVSDEWQMKEQPMIADSGTVLAISGAVHSNAFPQT